MRTEPAAEETGRVIPLFPNGPRQTFKETELGPLPEDWAVSSIVESCSKPEYGYTASAEQEPVGPRFLRITDIQEQGVNWDKVPYCRCDEATRKKHQLQPGDLLFARIGATTGKSFLVHNCPEAVYASYLIRVRAKAVDPAFLYYFCNSEMYWRQINANKGDKLKGGVSGSVLAQIRHCFPPLPEQRAITAVLSKIQAAVEAQDRIVATLKDLKAATMAKLFREGLRGEPRKQTEIGEIPESWEVIRLDALADLVSGGTPSKNRPEWWEGPIPWASPKDMKRPRLWDTEDHISAEALDHGSRLVPAKTIFVVIHGMILAKDLPVAMAEVPMAFNQDMKAVLSRDFTDAEYLLYAPSSRKGALVREISTSAHGTRRMGTSSLEALLLLLPAKEEQKEIAAALRSLEQREEIASRSRDTLKSLFSSMLHLLMTGQVRVNHLRLDEALSVGAQHAAPLHPRIASDVKG